MTIFSTPLLAIIAYLTASYILVRVIFLRPQSTDKLNLSTIAFAIFAVLAHAIFIQQLAVTSGSVSFSLSSMTAIISFILVTIFLLGCLSLPIFRLGVIVFPLTALSLVFSHFWPAAESPVSHSIWPFNAFSLHILLAITAYSLLSIATAQAILFVYQQHQIKKRNSPTTLAALPALQTMETLLFRLTWLGFGLLTFTLMAGAFFSNEIFGQPFVLRHHMILAIMGWCVYAMMLFKRLRGNLGGSQSVIWSLAGFTLIQLGYFGTKFISESLNT